MPSTLDPLDPTPDTWTIVLADRSSFAGTLKGIVRDLEANGFEVLVTETVPLDVLSVLGVHPFRGTVVFGGVRPSGSVAGWSARVSPYGQRPHVLPTTKARAWVKSQ